MYRNKGGQALAAVIACVYALGCKSDAAPGSQAPSVTLPGAAGAMTVGPGLAGTGAVPTMPVIGSAGGAGNASSGVAGTGVGAGGVGAPPTGGVSGGAGGAGVSGGGAGSAGTNAPMAGTGDPAACPAAPAGSSNEAMQALMAVNAARVAAGSGCMNMIAALNMSALNHCKYNAANATNAMCVADAHGEQMSCMGFTGADVAAREKAAGYSATGATEVLTSYGNMPVQAVPSWINTVWHRIPMLDPWTTDMGYGGAAGCDVIDFGRGTTGAPTSTVVVYPYNGQTGVPPSFSGREGPMPPAPTTGFPSSYPINVYAQAISVTEHVLTKDGDSTPLDHVWMDGKSSNVDPGYRYYLLNTAFMYGNAPFAPNTKYRVKITGTHTGGALNLEWTFTTGVANPFGP
jgi:uncharacterized protein YkwD